MKPPALRLAVTEFVLALFGVLAVAVSSAWGQARGLGFERARVRDMLKTVSREVEKKFYDRDLRGLDWKALTAQARQRIDRAQSVGEMLTAIFVLVDQLKDSHTFFVPPGQTSKVLYGFEAKAFGNEIRIYELKEGSAAAKAGLQPGDRIWAVNGFRLNRGNLSDFMLYTRVLRPVTVMDITYSRGDGAPRTVRVQAEVKEGKVIQDLNTGEDFYDLIREMESREETYHYSSYEGGIGYLHLPSFTTSELFLKKLVKEIKDSRAVILDLRGNPGGALDILEYFCGFFEPEPTVLAHMVGRKKPKPIKAKPRKPALRGPLFILVDSETASAAEVLARHFQRSGRAVVIGDQTAGHVTVARYSPFELGLDLVVFFGVSVAQARLVFPDGEELENRGVTPDQFCLPTAEDLRQERDPCRDRALALARTALGLSEPVESEESQKEQK